MLNAESNKVKAKSERNKAISSMLKAEGEKRKE
jgi:hypothetical protein